MNDPVAGARSLAPSSHRGRNVRNFGNGTQPGPSRVRGRRGGWGRPHRPRGISDGQTASRRWIIDGDARNHDRHAGEELSRATKRRGATYGVAAWASAERRRIARRPGCRQYLNWRLGVLERPTAVDVWWQRQTETAWRSPTTWSCFCAT